jgi:hypothetical protein
VNTRESSRENKNDPIKIVDAEPSKPKFVSGKKHRK